MRFGFATNMHERGRYRKFGRKHPNEKLYSEDIFSDRITQTRYR
jgi:hypothetical protein